MNPRLTLALIGLGAVSAGAGAESAHHWASANSTAYCQSGATASGKHTREGAVAMNSRSLGTIIRVARSPLSWTHRFQVTDRIGSGSELDFFVASCRKASNWGRHTVGYRVVGWKRPR